jgi:hypothetical protein
MPDILASDRPGQLRRRPRHWLRFAAAAIAAAVVAAANVSVAATHDRPARAAITCQGLGGTSPSLNPRPDLHPTPGSPAAFRLADQRSTTRWLNTQPQLYPTPGSPAAFCLADQRNLLRTAETCPRSPRTPSTDTPPEDLPSSAELKII